MIFALLLITATFRPATPAVGDLIAVEFQQPVRLEPSEKYEIGSQQGKRAVVRTFRPEPVELAGQAGDVRFRGLVIPIRSVLAPGDKLEPAPLKPPAAPPSSRRPWIAVAGAGAAAVAIWTAVMLLAARAVRKAFVAPMVPAAEAFRRTVAALRDDPRRPKRWAALADATRAYLAADYPDLGSELTTTEILLRFGKEQDPVRSLGEVLRMGDLEKFSPWGAPHRDFDSVATAALTLIPAPIVASDEVAA